VKGAPGGWLRRWWPALATGACSLAGAAVLTVQRMEINELRQSVQAFSMASAGQESLAPPPEAKEAPNSGAVIEDPEQEVVRLRGVASQLEADVSRLEQARATNEKLRAQLAAPVAAAITPEQVQAMEKAKAEAEQVMCVNNLKQLGLAARIWANDNGDVYPAEVLSMTNEMGSPKILACPGDKSHPAAKDWPYCSPANISYEYLAPSAPDGAEPTRVLFLCRIHGNVGLCDGSVQRINPGKLPQYLIERDGKLYFQPEPADPASTPTPTPGGVPNPNP
jgi:hypothetical protein